MRILRLVPLMALLAACSDTAGPGAGYVQLSTLVDQDAAPGEPNVEVTIQNRSAFPVLMFRCTGRVKMSVDRREDGRWEEYTGDFCGAVFEEPLELAPGASATSMRSLEESGRYRVRLNALVAGESGTPRESVSPAFEVR